MNDKIKEIVEDLKNKGYFKYNDSKVKRYSKYWNGFEAVEISQFLNILREYNLSSEDVNKYYSKIIFNLPVFPGKQYNNYQNYIKAGKEPSFKDVLNRFMNTQYKINQRKKVQSFKLDTGNIRNIDLNKIIQLLINNDIFTDKLLIDRNMRYQLIKYDSDKEELILINKDNFTDYIGINNDYLSNIIFSKANEHPTLLTNLDGLYYGFKKARQNDLTKKSCEDDYSYIVNLKKSFKLNE